MKIIGEEENHWQSLQTLGVQCENYVTLLLLFVEYAL